MNLYTRPNLPLNTRGLFLRPRVTLHFGESGGHFIKYCATNTSQQWQPSTCTSTYTGYCCQHQDFRRLQLQIAMVTDVFMIMMLDFHFIVLLLACEVYCLQAFQHENASYYIVSPHCNA